jgi:hypothetical protein
VIGIAWPYNFLVLIIAGVIIANNASNLLRLSYTIAFAFSVITALLWAHSFYVQHNLMLAAISLASNFTINCADGGNSFPNGLENWLGIDSLPTVANHGDLFIDWLQGPQLAIRPSPNRCQIVP